MCEYMLMYDDLIGCFCIFRSEIGVCRLMMGYEIWGFLCGGFELSFF